MCLHCYGHQIGLDEDRYPVYYCDTCHHHYLGSKIEIENDKHNKKIDLSGNIIIGKVFRSDGYKEIYNYAPDQRENTEQIMTQVYNIFWRVK